MSTSVWQKQLMLIASVWSLCHYATAQNTSTSDTTANLGSAILAGLGATTSASNASVLTNCQQQLASWSTATSNIVSPYPTNITSATGPYSETTSAIEGTGSVYTTIGGFAYASGNFTPTTTLAQYYTSYDYVTYTNVIATPSAFVNASLPPRPTCTIPATSCVALYSAYESSLGVNTATAGIFGPDLPFIWPIPSNSPRCTHTLTSCTYSNYGQGCYVSADTVQVFYWPSTTSRATITPAPNSMPLVTQVVNNITMTSPSIYLSFDRLMAYSEIGLDVACANGPEDGGASLSQLGSVYTNALYSIDPTAVSTLEMLNPSSSIFPDAAISALQGQDAEAYSYWLGQIAYDYNSLVPKALTYTDLTQPNPRAYYLRPHDFDVLPLGCNLYGPHSGCNTIYQKVYRAQLSLPDVLKSQDPLWAACSPGIRGAYDPPKALTAVASAAAVSMTSPTALTSSSAQPVDSTKVTLPQETNPAFTSSPVVAASDVLGSVAANSQHASPVSQAAQTVAFSTPTSPSTIPQTTSAQGPADVVSFSVAVVPVAVITAGSSTLTASSVSGNVVIQGTTISSGQAVSIAGATISNAGSAVVVQPAGAGSQAVVIDPTAVVVGGATLTHGQVTTVAGTVVSVGSTDAIIGGSTIPLSGSAIPAGSVVLGSGSAEAVAVGSITIPLTGGAANLTSAGIHTAVISVTQQPTLTLAGSTINADPSGAFVIGSQTLKPGSVITVGGTTISLATSDSYVVVNGKTTSLLVTKTGSTTLTYSIPSATATASTSRSLTASTAVQTSATLPGAAVALRTNLAHPLLGLGMAIALLLLL